MPDKAIEVLLKEGRKFPPPKEFKRLAHVTSARVFDESRKDPKAFWAKAAKELDGFKPWKQVLEWKCPWAKWFTGKINQVVSNTGFESLCSTKGESFRFSPLETPSALCPPQEAGLH